MKSKDFFTPGKIVRVEADGIHMKRCISEQKQFELSLFFHKSSPSGRSVYWTLRSQLQFTVVYSMNSSLSILWDFDFSSFLLFPSGSSGVGNSHSSQILATAILSFLLFLEASNKYHKPPFLLITKYSTVSHSSALCPPLNKL